MIIQINFEDLLKQKKGNPTVLNSRRIGTLILNSIEIKRLYRTSKELLQMRDLAETGKGQFQS